MTVLIIERCFSHNLFSISHPYFFMASSFFFYLLITIIQFYFFFFVKVFKKYFLNVKIGLKKSPYDYKIYVWRSQILPICYIYRKIKIIQTF